jgi:hypothetical protein
MHSSYFVLTLMANVAWFSMGFVFFSLRARRAVRILVPRSANTETSVGALVASLPFLGGFNLAFAALSGTSLISLLRGHAAPPFWHVYVASAIAHATQWAFNLPHALRGGRSGGAPWDVLRGPMLFIFAVDGACALLNATAAAWTST